MKRLISLFALMSILILSACDPAVRVENNVLPTLYSTSVPQSDGDPLILQGRYFGNGSSGGEGAESYVLLGADISGQGGVRVTPDDWSPKRIRVDVPASAGPGYVFVVAQGMRSNGLPANLP